MKRYELYFGLTYGNFEVRVTGSKEEIEAVLESLNYPLYVDEVISQTRYPFCITGWALYDAQLEEILDFRSNHEGVPDEELPGRSWERYELYIREIPDGEPEKTNETQPDPVQALQDGDWTVRAAACKELAEIGDASAVAALVQALRDWNWQVRVEACKALGRIGDPAVVPALERALQDVNGEVRKAARLALSLIR